MTTTFLATKALPYIVHVYSNVGTFKKTLRCLNRPTLSMVVNSTGQKITLDMPKSNTDTPLVSQGDTIKLTEQDGDGSVLFWGIVEDLPDSIDQTTEHQIDVMPIGVEAGDTSFTQNYTALTDVSQMIRDAVAQTTHLTATVTTVPNTGLTRIFNFNETNVLTVLQTAAKMAGVNYVWFIDELGQVWFGPAPTGAATYSVTTRTMAPVRKLSAPINNLKNYVKGFGAVLANTTTRIFAVYDGTAGSPYGKRALIPPLNFPNLTDQSTLQAIVNTVGQALNQIQTTVVLELPNYGTRLNLARVGGASIKYFEPSVDIYPESDIGSGAVSPVYVIMQVDVDGPVQRVTARQIALNVDDFVSEINEQMNRVSTDTVPALLPISPGQVTGATTGGSSTPAVPAFSFPNWSTGLDNIAQVNNAYSIVRWTPNAASDNAYNYEIRYSKNNDGNWTYIYPAAPLTLDVNSLGYYKISGLLQNTSYTYQIRAVNNLGIKSAWSTGQAQVTATQSAAPAVPTGLTAIKTPRGALVSWNGNTEADLQGYEIQVSVAGGAFSLVTPGWQLGTSLAYVAPSGTALGTSLAFQVRAANWSGNISAWSASSTAVTTDGIVFDELLVGNLKVFGTLTTGGFQTAASGARVVIDATSIRVYDGSATNWGAPSGAGVTAELTAATGNAFFKGTVQSSNVYASTVATSSTIGAVGSGSGFKLAGQFLDLYTQGTTAEGTRYWYTPDALTAFSLVGQLAAGTSTYVSTNAIGGTASVQVTKNVLKGTSFDVFEVVSEITAATESYIRGYAHSQYSPDTTGATYLLRKARGTAAAPAAVANGDTIGTLFATAFDGTNWLLSAGIQFVTSGGVSPYPTDIIFLTQALSGGTIMFERFRMKNDGSFWLLPGGGTGPSAYAPSSYGTVPVKFTEVVLAVAASAIIISSLPSTFRNLRILGIARSDTVNASTELKFTLNGSATAVYSSHILGADGITQVGPAQVLNDTNGEAGIIPVAADAASSFGTFELIIPNYAGTTAFKGWLYKGGFFNAGGGRIRFGDGGWGNTAAINSVTIVAAAGNLIAGTTVTCYAEP